MVSYFKTKETEKARLRLTDEGLQMEIKGEKYPFPGFPRGHILTSEFRFTNLAVMKHRIKNEIFNYAWDRLEKGETEGLKTELKKRLFNDIYPLAEKMKYDMLPPEKMCRVARELWRAFSALEKENDNIRKFKEILHWPMQEDDGYRFRMQWLFNYFKPRRIKTFELALHKLEEAEVLEDMKGKIRLLRRILLFALEDERIMYWFKRFWKEVDHKKLKLTKADKYFLRGKWFKCDHKIYSY